ncbi:MAG: tetratricopeptide repeat protein, partial [Acidobacteria bacterium]|nr:tetratricopeptide repeat protein [Acidobacteriota bacterium]
LSRVLYHSKGKFDEARAKLQTALKIGREIKDELVIAEALRNIGVVLWWGKGELDRPLSEFYEPALVLYRKHGDRRGEATMLSNISLIHLYKNDSYRHLKMQNESLAIRQSIGDQAGISESYKALGSAYSNMRNLKKAREYFERSTTLSKEIGYRLIQNESETSLAGVYVELGDYDQAITLFKQILDREKNSPILAKNRLGAIGNCYLLKGDYLNARDYFNKMLEISLNSDSDDVRALFASYVYLSEIHMALGDFESAAKTLQRSDEYYLKNAGLIQGHFGYGVTKAEFHLHEREFDRSLKFLNETADIELSLFARSGTNVVAHPQPKDYDRLFKLLLEDLNRELPANGSENDPAELLAFRFLEQRRYRSFRNFIVRSGTKNISSTQAGESEKAALAKIQRVSEELNARNDPKLQERLYKAYSEYENAVVKEQYSQKLQQAMSAAQPSNL